MFSSEKLVTVAVILCHDGNVSAIGSKAREMALREHQM